MWFQWNKDVYTEDVFGMCVCVFVFSFSPISQPNNYAVSQSYIMFWGSVILKTVLVYAFFSPFLKKILITQWYHATDELAEFWNTFPGKLY